MVRCFILVLLLSFGASAADQRPLELPDILAWKRIQSPVVSNDGGWFAYKIVPNEGDAELVVRNLGDGKEQRFPIGEQPRIDFAPGGPLPMMSRDLVFSEDSKWVAFLSFPTSKEAKALAKQRKPVQSKAVVVELATAKKTEFEKVRRLAFSGPQSTVVAFHRFGAAPAGPAGGGSPAAPAGPGGGAGGPGANDDRPSGSDLIVFQPATGNTLNFGNVSEFAFDKTGRWLAWLIDAQDKIGNGVQVLNLTSGAVMPLDSAAKASYKGLSWTEKGDALATLRGVEDKKFEDKRYTLVAFKGFPSPEKIIYDPSGDQSFPKGMSIAAARTPVWLKDLDAVTFGIHELKAKKDSANGKPEGGEGAAPAGPPAASAQGDDNKTRPDLILWHYKDRRLPSMQQVQENSDKNFSYLALYRPAEKKFVQLADEAMRQVTVNPESRFGMGIDVRDYELESNLDGQRYEDVYRVNLATGERKLALKKARWVTGPSPDNSKLLYYEDGHFYSYDMATGKPVNLTQKVPSTFWDAEDDHNVVKPPTRPIGWSADSSAVLVSDGWDIWKLPASGTGPAVNLTVNGKKDKIRYRTRYRLDLEEKGIDLAALMYVSIYGEWTKKGGIGRIEAGKAGVAALSWDDAGYNQLMKAKNADVYLYTRETPLESPNFLLAKSARLDGAVKVTDANPQQKDFLWTAGTRLIDYTSDKGDKLQGTLYLPANYQQGKQYPMVVLIYEKLSQGTNLYSFPGFNGFNPSVYTSNGFAVLTPDIVYKVNDPGMSAVWCVVPAVKAAIATGVVDAKRVGLHGHSWGGYQTAFLVTQTNVFHAAVAGAPLTDMVSMYSSIYWNTGSANQPIFESSQGRFTGGYWENPEAYIRNSPVYHAKNVTTPLMILHNDKDGAVDFTQGIEYFNTLRRLGKPVIMLEYKGENHGLRKPENMKDYTVRMKEFFNYHLRDQEPPKWMLEGVPLLQMKEHLEERDPDAKKVTENRNQKGGAEKKTEGPEHQ